MPGPRNVDLSLANGGRQMQAVIAVPVMTDGGNVSATANGAVFVAFPAAPCAQLTVVAPKAVDVEVRQGGAGAALPIYAGTSFTFFGITDASQLGVRRVDQAATDAVVVARWER